MVYKVTLITIILLFISNQPFAQLTPSDSLKAEILRLDGRIKKVELNLTQAQQKFQNGILIATIGYVTTITGGLMLGRTNDDLGQSLLVVGGAAGIFGTYKLVDAFGYLNGSPRKKKKRKTK